MGCYVNPPGMQKEPWLLQHGVLTNKPEITEDTLPVCLVNNGPFNAAGVAFSQEELNVFATEDGREKLWFQVPIDKLFEVSDLKVYRK